MSAILESYSRGRITRDALLYILEGAVKAGSFNEQTLPSQLNENEFMNEVDNSSDIMDTIELYHPEKRHIVFMGALMKKLKGKNSCSVCC